MKKLQVLFDLSIAGVISVLQYMFGGFDMIVQILVLSMIVDYITGMISSFILNEWSSKVGAKGIAKKIMIVCIVGLCVLVDRILSPEKWIFRTMACSFYIANEGLSILENACKIGVPVPAFIKSSLAQLKEQNNATMDNTHGK